MESCDIIILNYIKLINSNNLFVNCKYNGFARRIRELSMRRKLP